MIHHIHRDATNSKNAQTEGGVHKKFCFHYVDESPKYLLVCFKCELYCDGALLGDFDGDIVGEAQHAWDGGCGAGWEVLNEVDLGVVGESMEQGCNVYGKQERGQGAPLQ